VLQHSSYISNFNDTGQAQFVASHSLFRCPNLFFALASASKDRWHKAFARIGKRAWIAIYPGTFVRVARVFMLPETQPVVQAAPRVMFKYLGSYVVLGLSRQERASILIDHYAYLKERAHGDFFRSIIDGRLELWRQGVGEDLTASSWLFHVQLTTREICL
jgi:uncharacterized protein VirK/YbjX